MNSATNTIELAAKVAQTLEGVQVRAEAGKAIAVVNGMQEVMSIYGTEMNYEDNKELFDAMVQSANVAIRTSQGAVMDQVMTRNESEIKDLKSDAEGKVFGAKTKNVIVSVNGKQDFLTVEIENKNPMPELCADIVKALNGAYKKSILVAGEKLEKLSK